VGRLKLFRAEHGGDEIDEEGEGDEADDDVFHGGCSVEFFAKNGVGGAEREEGECGADEKKILQVHGLIMPDGGLPG